MPVAVYKLRIRDTAGDDSAWQEARVVAASVGEALVQAQQRFGEERVMAVAQDAVGEPLDDEEAAAQAAADSALAEAAADASILARPPDSPAVVEAAMARSVKLAYASAASAPPDPMPWEGRWRPSVLVWIGIGVGLLLFAFWFQVGTPARERFVTAAPATADKPPGLALDDDAPPGGVLAATGVGVRPRPRRNDEDVVEAMVGEAVAHLPDDTGMDEEAADDVRSIGTLVGEMFSRWPDTDEPADAPPYRGAESSVGPQPPYRSQELPPASREASVLRPFYVEVDRNGIIETLRVTAYDRDHARAIVSDLPERPVILRGPSPQLVW